MNSFPSSRHPIFEEYGGCERSRRARRFSGGRPLAHSVEMQLETAERREIRGRCRRRCLRSYCVKTKGRAGRERRRKLLARRRAVLHDHRSEQSEGAWYERRGFELVFHSAEQ